MVKGKSSIWGKIGKVLGSIGLITLAFIQMFPLIWLLDYSLCESRQLFGEQILIWPGELQWGNYYTAIFESQFFHYIGNSILINAICIVCVLVFSVMAAFACVRMRWKLKGVVTMILLLGLMIPGAVTLLPNFLIFTKTGLYDTIWALLLPYIAFPLSTGFLLTSRYMESVPRELEEAALLDGCGIYRLVFTIVMPIMKNSLATVAIMTFLGNWNEYISAMTYLSSDTWKTLPFLVKDFTGLWSSDYAVQFAVMMLSVLPALIVYVFMNKYLIKGVAVGAVKT